MYGDILRYGPEFLPVVEQIQIIHAVKGHGRRQADRLLRHATGEPLAGEAGRAKSAVGVPYRSLSRVW